MRPPKPLPTVPPILTFYTPTYMRPQALARCMASVTKQTRADRVEQLVLPDHAGYGLAGGLFGRIPWYASACRGDYVNIMADDDELADERVVEQFEKFVDEMHRPAVVIALVEKNGRRLPDCSPAEAPLLARVDMSSYILRRDIWLKHAADYGLRYEGDWDHASKLWEAGYRHEFFDRLFLRGAASNGRPETDWR